MALAGKTATTLSTGSTQTLYTCPANTVASIKSILIGVALASGTLLVQINSNTVVNLVASSTLNGTMLDLPVTLFLQPADVLKIFGTNNAFFVTAGIIELT